MYLTPLSRDMAVYHTPGNVYLTVYLTPLSHESWLGSVSYTGESLLGSVSYTTESWVMTRRCIIHQGVSTGTWQWVYLTQPSRNNSSLRYTAEWRLGSVSHTGKWEQKSSFLLYLVLFEHFRKQKLVPLKLFSLVDLISARECDTTQPGVVMFCSCLFCPSDNF